METTEYPRSKIDIEKYAGNLENTAAEVLSSSETAKVINSAETTEHQR